MTEEGFQLALRAEPDDNVARKVENLLPVRPSQSSRISQKLGTPADSVTFSPSSNS